MFEIPPEQIQRGQHAQLVERLNAIEQSFPKAIGALVQYLDGKVTKTQVVNQLQSMSTPDVKFVVDAIEKLDSTMSKKNVDLAPIVTGLKALEHQLELIPKQLPQIIIKPDEIKVPTSVSVNNLPDWQSQFKGIVDSIKNLKITTEVPKVDVKAPQVNVAAPRLDLTPFKNEITKVVYAIEAIKLPEAKETDVTGIEKRLEGLAEWLDLLDKNTKETNKRLKKLIDKPTLVSGGSSASGGGYQFVDSGTPKPLTLVNGSVPVVNPDGTNIAGGGSGGGAVTIADGADATQGAVADAVVAAGATGTVSAKLRRLTTDLDSVKTNTSNIPAKGQTTMANSQPVAIASDQSAVPVSGTFWQATQPVSGTVAATQSGTWTVQPGNTANTIPWLVSQATATPVLKNGLTNSASSVVSSTAAVLSSYYVYNPNSSVAYVQIFDVATAGGVTVGTTTPKWSIGIPATSAANLTNMHLSFANGVQVAATTSATGSTAPSTALDCNFGYR